MDPGKNSKLVKKSSRKQENKEEFIAKIDSEIRIDVSRAHKPNLFARSIERRPVNWTSELFGEIVRKDVRPSSVKYRQGPGAQPKCGRGYPNAFALLT